MLYLKNLRINDKKLTTCIFINVNLRNISVGYRLVDHKIGDEGVKL